MKVRITFIEELLGTASGDPEIHNEFIASKAPNAPSREEEIATIGVDAEIEKSKTVFSRNKEGKPILWDYQIKGFFKDACSMLYRVKGTKSSDLKAYKKTIDGLIFPGPRQIELFAPDGFDVPGTCQRPLRAQTAQGERIALACSETMPAGTACVVDIVLMDTKYNELVVEWLNYGKLRGIGQWRNSGKGRFWWEEVRS